MEALYFLHLMEEGSQLLGLEGGRLYLWLLRKIGLIIN